MKIAIPDLISNSYFPAAAAVELGFFKEEGLQMELELIFPVDRTLEVLRDGDIQFVGGSAHSTPHAFPEWDGGKLLASLAQGMYWFLIVRTDLNAKRGKIQGIDPGEEMQTIRAYVPMAEVLNYAADITSLTGGRGMFVIEFDHYEDVPDHLMKKIIDEANQKFEEK